MKQKPINRTLDSKDDLNLDELINLPQRTKNLSGSLIREILKASIHQKSMLSLAGGLPDTRLIHKEDWLAASKEAIQFFSMDLFQYGESQGYLPLREWITNHYYARFSEESNVENILVTHGSQQGLDLIGKVLLDENSILILEEPTYLGAIQAFRSYGALTFVVPLDKDGIELDQLDKTISKLRAKASNTKNPIVFYTNPDFQNPSTIQWNEEVRIQTARILDEYNVILVEDEAYKLLSFGNTYISSISSFRKSKDLNIQLGSFSKILSPGFRLGWMKLPHFLSEKFLFAKQSSDLNSNQFSQVLVNQYLLKNSDLNFLSANRSYYFNQKNFLSELLKSEIPDLKFEDPNGGMFLWAVLEGIDTMELFRYCLKKNLAFVPGAEFYNNKKQTQSLRLNFSLLSHTEMEMAVQILKSCINELKK